VTQRPPGQVTGRKRVVLWPPTQDENLYVRDIRGPPEGNLDPKPRQTRKRCIGNHRKYPFLTPDWPAP
jgi:hypothetical protein